MYFRRASARFACFSTPVRAVIWFYHKRRFTRIKWRPPPAAVGGSFPLTGIYYRLSHMLQVPRSFAALRMTVGREGKSRNADFISIAAKGGYPQPSAPKAPSNLRTFGPEGPINLKNPHAPGVSISGAVPYKISFPLLTLQKFYTTIVVNYQMPYREIPPIEP